MENEVARALDAYLAGKCDPNDFLHGYNLAYWQVQNGLPVFVRKTDSVDFAAGLCDGEEEAFEMIGWDREED